MNGDMCEELTRWCWQGAKSHGAGASKQSGRARSSARSGNGSDGGAAEREEPRTNGHKRQQGNGWQRGFLSNGNAANGSGAAARDHSQEGAPDDGHADSSGNSSSEQWEPDGHPAAQQVL